MRLCAAVACDDLCGVFDGVGHGLFAVDVVAGFERRQDVLGVQAERRGDDDGVEVFAIEERAIVGVGGYLVSAGLVQLGEARRVDIGGGGDFDSGNAEEAADEFLAAAAGADDAEAEGRRVDVARAIWRAASVSAFDGWASAASVARADGE